MKKLKDDFVGLKNLGTDYTVLSDETLTVCFKFIGLLYGEEEEEVKPWSQGWLIAAGAYPGFCSMKRLEVFLLLLDRGMLVHRRSLPRNFARFPQQFAGTHLYTWVERVSCPRTQHNGPGLSLIHHNF